MNESSFVCDACGEPVQVDRDLVTYHSKCDTSSEWRETVIDALIVNGIYTAEHDTNPRKALADLIAWEIKVALHPSVSQDARDLLLINVSDWNKLCRLEGSELTTLQRVRILRSLTKNGRHYAKQHELDKPASQRKQH